jgi:hypothetical protein
MKPSLRHRRFETNTKGTASLCLSAATLLLVHPSWTLRHRTRLLCFRGRTRRLSGSISTNAIHGRQHLRRDAVSWRITSQNSLSMSCHSSSRRQACTMLLHCCAIRQAISRISTGPRVGWTAADSSHELVCNAAFSPGALPTSARVKIASRIWGGRPGQAGGNLSNGRRQKFDFAGRRGLRSDVKRRHRRTGSVWAALPRCCQAGRLFRQIFILQRLTKWGRRESNACPAERNQHAPQYVTTTTESLSGNCQDFLCAQCHQLAVSDNRMARLTELADSQDCPDICEIAWQLAQQCRSIVQACLREEEWQDADREFWDVIRQGISEWCK